MYEMQGPRLAFPRRPAGCPASPRLLDQPLVPGTRLKFRFPGSSASPGLPPAWFPSPAVTYFYCLGGSCRKGPGTVISRFFSRPQAIHKSGLVVPRSRHFSTSPSTTSRTGSRQAGTWGRPEAAGLAAGREAAGLAAGREAAGLAAGREAAGLAAGREAGCAAVRARSAAPSCSRGSARICTNLANEAGQPCQRGRQGRGGRPHNDLPRRGSRGSMRARLLPVPDVIVQSGNV
jgi:hypothetical protein